MSWVHGLLQWTTSFFDMNPLTCLIITCTSVMGLQSWESFWVIFLLDFFLILENSTNSKWKKFPVDFRAFPGHQGETKVLHGSRSSVCFSVTGYSISCVHFAETYRIMWVNFIMKTDHKFVTLWSIQCTLILEVDGKDIMNNLTCVLCTWVNKKCALVDPLWSHVTYCFYSLQPTVAEHVFNWMSEQENMMVHVH